MEHSFCFYSGSQCCQNVYTVQSNFQLNLSILNRFYVMAYRFSVMSPFFNLRFMKIIVVFDRCEQKLSSLDNLL
jgi:hypothetical protein